MCYAICIKSSAPNEASEETMMDCRTVCENCGCAAKEIKEILSDNESLAKDVLEERKDVLEERNDVLEEQNGVVTVTSPTSHVSASLVLVTVSAVMGMIAMLW